MTVISIREYQGIIQPSSSPWSSPVVLVPKKDGTTRFCVDYRRLIAVSCKDAYPLPQIEDILSTLGEAKYFITLDLASGYWQIELEESSRPKTTFATHQGLFEFTSMAFGLRNAPATFQRLMQVILAGLEWKCCYMKFIPGFAKVPSPLHDLTKKGSSFCWTSTCGGSPDFEGPNV